MCPVRALEDIVCDLESNKSDRETELCTCFCRNQEKHVTCRDIQGAIKTAAARCNLERKGFPLNKIGTHSLRAGGAMVLKLNGVDELQIKKFGQWTSAQASLQLTPC